MKFLCEVYHCTLETGRCLTRQLEARRVPRTMREERLQLSACRACDQGIAVAAGEGVQLVKLGKIKCRVAL